MKIFINEKEMSVMLEKENTLYEVMLPLEAWCNDNGLLINSIRINETEDELIATEKTLSSVLVSNVWRLDIIAVSNAEYSFEAIESTVEYLERVSNIVPEAVCQTDLEAILDGFDWALDSIPRAIFLLDMTLESTNLVHLLKMLEVKQERVEFFWKNLKDDSKDRMVSFLKEDLLPFLKEKMIPSMENVLMQAEISILTMFAASVNEDNALYRVGTIPRFANAMINMLTKTSSSLQMGLDKDAFMSAEKFSQTVFAMFSLLSSVATLYIIDFNKIEKDGISLQSAITEFNEIMNEVVSAFSNEDYVSIADLLEYEVKSKLENIIDYTVLIETHIVGLSKN